MASKQVTEQIAHFGDKNTKEETKLTRMTRESSVFLNAIRQTFWKWTGLFGAPLTQHPLPETLQEKTQTWLDNAKVEYRTDPNGRIFVRDGEQNGLWIGLIEAAIFTPQNEAFFWLFSNPDYDQAVIAPLPQAYKTWEKELGELLASVDWVASARVKLSPPRRHPLQPGVRIKTNAVLHVELHNSWRLCESRVALLQRLAACRVPGLQEAHVQVDAIGDEHPSFGIDREAWEENSKTSSSTVGTVRS